MDVIICFNITIVFIFKFYIYFIYFKGGGKTPLATNRARKLDTWPPKTLNMVEVGVPVMVQQLMNLTSIHKDVGSIPGPHSMH